MNDLAHLIKSLAYSLTVVPASKKCIVALAQHHEFKPELEKLLKGLSRHKSGGYDLETKQFPTESTCMTILNRIQTNQPKVTELQKQCHLLTALEKAALQNFIDSILQEMEQRASTAQSILEKMAKSGISVDDLSS